MGYIQRFHAHIQRHPFNFVKYIINSNIENGNVSQDVSIQLSKYKYAPQSFTDNRSHLTLPFKQFNEETLCDVISNLDSSEELAFHSLIQGFGGGYHFPLVDFGKVDRGILDKNPLFDLSEHWGMSFYIYNSGRSFHAYGNRLIKSSDWVSFMGGLLLLNKPSGFKLIDERWVGHRLMAGYSTLRWSNNSKFYKKYPTFIGVLSSEGLKTV